MSASGAAVSVAPVSLGHTCRPQGDPKLQSVTDAEIKIHGFKKCTIMGGIGLRVNFIICDVSCPIIGNSTATLSGGESVLCSGQTTSSLVMDHELAFTHGAMTVKIDKHDYTHSQESDQCINDESTAEARITKAISSQRVSFRWTTHSYSPHNGRDNHWDVKCSHCRAQGSHSKCPLRSQEVHGEPAIKRFAEARITSLNGEAKSSLSLACSHQSLGSCEGWHAKLFSLRLLAFQSVRSLQIIQSFHGWSSMLDALITDSN
eukprot:892962-Amphidinium_carterae.1